MDICHLKNAELETKAPEKRSSCTPRWHCGRWFRIACSIHWTGMIDVTNDGIKSNGYDIQTTRMRRKSSGRNISLHPGRNGRCTIIVENSEVRMSRCWDTSTKTQNGPKSWSSMEDPVVPLKRNLYGHPSAGLLWERQFDKVLSEHGWEKFKIGNAYSLAKKKDYSCLCMRTIKNWLERKTPIQCGKYLWKTLIWDNRHRSLTMLIWVALNNKVKQIMILWTISKKYVWIQNLCWATEKLPYSEKLGANIRHGGSCQKMCGTILWVGKQDDSTTLQSINIMHWRPPIQGRMNGIRWRIAKGLLTNCSKMFKRIGRPDILWSVNKLARSITKWTKACDKRLCRLMSYIHHICDYKKYCHVGNNAEQCRLGLFQDSAFAGVLEDSKSTSGGTFCVFGSHTFVPISWMCKKQTSVSHSSTESEIISLDAGLRLDGIPALDLWDLIVEVLGNTNQSHEEQGQLLMNKREVLEDVDRVPSNVQFSHQEALLYVFEDNEAVIKMIIKGRSPTMRHVSRTHRVDLDWVLGRINLDSKDPN